jgi:Thermostable hemolysin
VRKLTEKPRAVAGMTVTGIDEDSRLYELQHFNYHLRLVEPAQPRRAEVQAFIADAYQRVFDADIRDFYPSLIALHRSDDQLQGAAGARHADGQHLFLEQYLDIPIEQAIRLFAGIDVGRTKVVELGNLSVARPALTYPFISLIGAWLQTYEIEWLVFALTRTLQRVFTTSTDRASWQPG